MPVDGSLLVNSGNLMSGRLCTRGFTFPDSLIGADFGFDVGSLVGFSTGLALGTDLRTDILIEEARTQGEREGFAVGLASAPDEVPDPAPTVLFTMRAFKTTIPTGFVYWDVEDEPDLTGDQSPYPPADLSDIVVVNRVDLQ